MQITEVRVDLADEKLDRYIRAFANVTFDQDYVLRDLKVIACTTGYTVCMPSRKLTSRCNCGCKNHLRARYCNQCGIKLDYVEPPHDRYGRRLFYADVFHPINREARQAIDEAVLFEYDRVLNETVPTPEEVQP